MGILVLAAMTACGRSVEVRILNPCDHAVSVNVKGAPPESEDPVNLPAGEEVIVLVDSRSMADDAISIRILSIKERTFSDLPLEGSEEPKLARIPSAACEDSSE